MIRLHEFNRVFVMTNIDFEREFHDRKFQQKSNSKFKQFAKYPQRYSISAFTRLQSCRSLRVLDLGCGIGVNRARFFTSKGCQYTGVDISSVAINSNKRDAEKEGIEVKYVCDDANTLSSLNGLVFDRIIVSSTLHHLDIPSALDAFSRLLSTGGDIVMREPMGTNPFLKIFRHFTPAIRTPDEHPLLFSDINLIREKFTSVSLEFHSLLSFLLLPIAALQDIFSCKTNLTFLANLFGLIDVWLGKVPCLRRLHWIVLIKAIK